MLKNLKLILVISRDVYSAALKERMMYGFLLLALLFILMANVPFTVNNPQLFEGQPALASALQIGFVSVNIFIIIISVFVSLSVLQNLLAKERLILLLSKPVARWQIFQGIVLGLFEMVFVNWFLMTSGIWLVVVSQAKIVGLYVWVGMSVTLLMSLLYISLVLFFYVSFPNTIAGILAIFAMISGFGAPMAREAFLKSTYPVFIRKVFDMAFNILPQINDLWAISMNELHLFNLKIHSLPVILQTICLILALNFISCRKFRKLCCL